MYIRFDMSTFYIVCCYNAVVDVMQNARADIKHIYMYVHCMSIFQMMEKVLCCMRRIPSFKLKLTISPYLPLVGLLNLNPIFLRIHDSSVFVCRFVSPFPCSIEFNRVIYF